MLGPVANCWAVFQCHGAVGTREVLFQEKAVSMFACMQCHEKYEAPNDCEVCHDTH